MIGAGVMMVWGAVALAQSVTLSTATRALDPAGGQMTFSADVNYPDDAGYELTVEVPRGWEYVAGEGEPAARPFVGAQVKLEWTDYPEARGPRRIGFTVRYPAGVTSASIVPRLGLTRRVSPPPRLPFPGWEVFMRVDGAPINFGAMVPPSIRYQPVNRTVGVEGVVWISVAAEGTAPLHYQWRKNGQPIAGATSAIHSIFPSRLEDAGRFDVVVSNAVGSITSRVAELTVKNGNPGQAAPVIDAQPLDVSATAAGLAVFSTIAFSNHLVSYQWQRNGGDIAGATGQSLVLPQVQAGDAGAYAVVVSNAYGRTTSRAARLDVGPAWTGGEPPRIEEQPAGFERVVSEAGVLRVGASGTAPLRYQWFRYGVPIPGATREALELDGAPGGPASGNYRVMVSNGLGAVLSEPAVVRLLSSDVAPPRERSSQGVRVVAGASATFTAPASGSPPYSYQWFKGDAAIAGATGATLTIPTAAPTDAGTYRAVVTSLLGSALHIASLALEPESVVQAPVIRGPSSPVTAAWDNPVALVLTVDGIGPLVYQWFKDGREIAGATEARLAIAAAQFSDAGEYALRATNRAGTAVSDTVRLEVRPPSGTIASAGPSGMPALVTQPRAATVSEGAAAGFHVTARAEVAPVSYQWRKNGVAIPGATSAVYVVRRAAADDGGYYSVVVWNARGATTSEAARLAVGPADPRAAEEAARRRLRNVSTRAVTSDGEAAMTAGFVVAGEAPLPVLVRAIGPTLGAFGVTGELEAAQVEVFRDGESLAMSEEWNAASDARVAAAAQRVGAFALPARSRDGALLLNLEPGSYTARVSGGAGVALIEVYEAREDDAVAGSRLVNLATRGRTGPGEGTLTAGFVITAPRAKRVLVRGIGPGLAGFGVSGAIADTQVRIYAGTTQVAANDDWESGESAAEVAVLGAQVGAFALAPGSRDAALVAELAPGAYTVQVSGAGESGGVALVEIYEVP